MDEERGYMELRSSEVGRAILDAIGISYLRDLRDHGISRTKHYIYPEDLASHEDAGDLAELIPSDKAVRIMISIVDPEDD